MIRSEFRIIFFIAFVALSFSGCGQKVPVSQNRGGTDDAGVPDKADEDTLKHKVMSFDLEGLTDSGAKKWDVKGESAEAISENRVKLNKIVASAYGDDAQATITADKGIYDRSKNNVHLEENVIATIENVNDKNSGFMGLSGVSGKDSEEKGMFSEKPKKTKTVITCEAEVEFDYEKNKAYFKKDVHIVNDEGMIDADKVTINLNPATKKIMEIVAEGNVKITRGENISYSDKATYIESEKKILLTGEPRMVIYQEGGMKDKLLGK